MMYYFLQNVISKASFGTLHSENILDIDEDLYSHVRLPNRDSPAAKCIRNTRNYQTRVTR
jgi:hypothetical protein